MATKKPHSITFKFDSSPKSQSQANALISALSGKPFPGTKGDSVAHCPTCDTGKECAWQGRGSQGGETLRCLTCGTLFDVL